ncbi:Trigger factor [Paraconexibacter sp. AEG42_29]|uniref:Trigger factor n=1 Tax=Paraconexibacter sp. AEG42_29 TaxID=2997339 RepID=A0AAU7AXT1_9ACTN
MAAVTDPITTTVTELPESRVRVAAEVSPAELERRLQEAARQFGRDLRMPGFRKGKVPPPVVIKQVGREAVLDEAIRTQIGRWYTTAIDAAGIAPVGEPELDLGEMPEAGAPLTFTFEIGVRPIATLGDYKGVEAPKKDVEPDPATIDDQVEQLRERAARLETKEGAAEAGDFVVMDFKGFLNDEAFEGGEGRDQMVELGTGTLIPGFEEQLVGASAGDEKRIDVTFPEEYQAEHLAGQEAQFDITVKEVKAKELPDLDDDFASDSAGFDTLEELREDLAAKLREDAEKRVDGEYREAVLDAVTANATVEVPDALIVARAKELYDRMLGSLAQQGISKEAYLGIAQKSEDEILEEAKPDADQALRREAVIHAVIAAEDIKPSDGDVLDALQATAVRENTTPEKLRARLEKNGRLSELLDDLAQGLAMDLLVDNATAVPAPPEPDADADADAETE